MLRWLAPILILWLALFLRVWQLDVLPPGLHYDEAFNGVEARLVARGEQFPIFFVDNFGEEPIHMYEMALLFKLVGELPWTIRLTSVISGVVAVAALYACGRSFFPRSRMVAPIAAFLGATLYWAINFSRIGLETNSMPMMLILSAAALGHAYRTMQWRWVVGAGFLLGASVYTYLASRVWLVAVLLWFLYLVLLHRQHVRAHFSKWVVLGLVAALTLAPLTLFFIANPVAFTGRSGTVFTPETFLNNFLHTAAMFSLRGDMDPRDNLVGRPALDTFLSIFFYLGLVLSLARFRKPLYGFLVIWFVVMCLPSALTEFAPNFRRAIGAMPAMILFCALGMEWLLERVLRLGAPIPNLKRVGYAALFVALGISAFWSARAYFVDWASGPGLYYSFDAGLLDVGRALAAQPRDQELYLTPDYDEHYTLLWELDGRHVSAFDGRRALVLPDSSRAATYGIITHEDKQTLSNLARAFSQNGSRQEFFDAQGQPYATLLTFAPNTRVEFDNGNAVHIRADAFAQLIRTRVLTPMPQRDAPYQVELEWRAEKAADQNYTVTVQLLGPPNPHTGTRVWAQEDKQPAGGTYPTTAWRKGESIVESFTLKIPRDAPPGEYRIQVGMYLLETGARVPLFDAANQTLDDNLLTLDAFTLE